MTSDQAKRFVVVSTVGTGVLTVVGTVHDGRLPSARIGMGVLVSGVILATVAEFSPNIAGGLAALMLTTAAFAIGGNAWEGIKAATSITPVQGTN